MPLTHLECSRCQRQYPAGEIHSLCECGGPLFARYDLDRAAKNMRPGHLALREPTLWRYDDVLPVDNPDYRISLGEGFTPLLTARRLGSAIGIPRLSIKDESGNPTGSFKARGLALAVSMAKSLGATHGVDSSKEDPIEAIRALTGGNGADVVIDAVGRPETYKQAFYARDLAGRVVLVGVPAPDMKLELPLLDVFGRGGSLKSSWYGDCLPSRDFPMLVEHYKQGNLDLDAFVTERITIDQVEEAFAKMHEGKVLRSVVEL